MPRGFRLAEESDGRGVGGGVVITDCESVVIDPTALVSDDMPGTVTATLTSGRDTMVSPAVMATVKACGSASPIVDIDLDGICGHSSIRGSWKKINASIPALQRRRRSAGRLKSDRLIVLVGTAYSLLSFCEATFDEKESSIIWEPGPPCDLMFGSNIRCLLAGLSILHVDDLQGMSNAES